MWIDNFDLNYTCSIIRPVFVSDGYGGLTTSNTTIVSNKKCAYWQESGSEIVIGDRVQHPVRAKLAIEPDTGYLSTDKVIISGSTYTLGNPDNVNNEDAIMIFELSKP